MLYTCRYTVTTRMIPALRWAAMRAILMFQSRKWWTKSQDSVHKPQPFWRERRAEAVLNRGPSAYQPNALPLGQTSSRSHPMERKQFVNVGLHLPGAPRVFGWADTKLTNNTNTYNLFTAEKESSRQFQLRRLFGGFYQHCRKLEDQTVTKQYQKQ